MTGPPRSFQPSKGVLRPLDSNRFRSTVTGQVEVEQGQVGVGPDGDAPFGGQAEPAGRSGRKQLDEPAEGDRSGPDQAVEHEGDGGLQADDAERGLGERPGFFGGRVGGMVGGDGVDRARPEAFDQGGRVGGRRGGADSS